MFDFISPPVLTFMTVVLSLQDIKKKSKEGKDVYAEERH